MPALLSLRRPAPAPLSEALRPRPRVRPRPLHEPGNRISPIHGRLRLAVAVAADVARDGVGGEFELARTRVLQWIGSRFGPLPPGFAENPASPESEGNCRVERHERKGTVVRAVDQRADSGRYFGLSLELGSNPGLPVLRALVVLTALGGSCRLRTSLRYPLRRSRRRSPQVWVPGIVRGLARSPGLVDYGWRIQASPWIVRDDEGVRGLIELISEPKRTRPVFAIGLAPGQQNPETAPLDPFDLAHRTAGLAHVVVVTGPMTYVLTDRVGRRFSVFGNAVRTYRPGCRFGDEQREHPMALSETVRQWKAASGNGGGGPSQFAAFLTSEAARTSVALQASRPPRAGLRRRSSGGPAEAELVAPARPDMAQNPMPLGAPGAR